MLRMLPLLPMLRRLALLPMLSTDAKLPTLSNDAALARLSTLANDKTDHTLRELKRLVCMYRSRSRHLHANGP